MTRHTVLLLTSALVALPAVAQTAPPSTTESSAASASSKTPSSQTAGNVASPTTGQSDGIGDIIVTAERRETKLQDTPISITAFTASGLEAQGIRNVNDLGGTVPNLTTTTGPQGSADANFFIRGVGQFDFIATNDPGVGVYVNGVYLGRTVGALIDSGNIARVEILRGPQGTLFGRNTLGGAVSITTKQPELNDVSGDVRLTTGSRSRIDVDGAFNLPIGQNAAVRVYAFERYQNGWATNPISGQTYGKTKRDGTQAEFLWKPTERLTINLEADYSLDKSNPAPSVLRAAVPAPFFPADIFRYIQDPNHFYRVYESNDQESRNEIYGFTGTVAYDLGGGNTLKSITAYRHLDAVSSSDPDGTPYRIYDQFAPTHQNQFSEELQLTGTTLHDRLTYVLGGYYFHERVNQTLNLCFAPITPTPAVGAYFNNCNIWSQGNDQNTNSYAVFGQARVKIIDNLSVTLGGRYTSEQKTDVSNQFFDFRPAGFSPFPGLVVPGFVAPIVTDLPGRVSFKKFTPKGGVEWKPTRSLLLFADYAEGFRSGGFNGRLIAPQPTIPTYRPDINHSIEGGFKYDFNRNLRLNATAFRSLYLDIQETISDPVVQFRVANSGRAVLYGFEAELTGAYHDLRVNASVGYTHSEFRPTQAQTAFPVDPATGIAFGNRLPFAPEVTYNIGAEYGLDLGDKYGRLTPRVDFKYSSRTFFSPFNLPLEQQGPLGLLQARITYLAPGEKFSLSIFGDNLTDRHYYTFGQNALGAQGVAYEYLGRPREFGVTGAVKF